jgi:hypothetical protein
MRVLSKNRKTLLALLYPVVVAAEVVTLVLKQKCGVIRLNGSRRT